VRAGDTLVVPKLDRLARSVPDARAIGDDLAARGIKLSLGGQVYDPTDPTAHFNRFGRYNLDLTRVPPALDYDAPILSPDPRHKSSEAGPS
jgi:hypothetical protein